MREDSSPPYSQAPTDFRAAVTTDENPGPQEELLLLPIPSSRSMNTQQHPRSRSSYSGGRPTRRATSGAGRHRSKSAGPSAPRGPLPFPSHRRIQSQPGVRAGEGAPPPRGPGAGDLGEPATDWLSPTAGAGRWAPHLGPDPVGVPRLRHCKQAPPPAPARRLPGHPRREGPNLGPPARPSCPGRWWAAG